MLNAIVLGLVQALTEFLPVSSSGHLVIAKSLLGVREVGITLEVVTHFATVVAVIVYLRKRIGSMLLAGSKGLFCRGAGMLETEIRDLRLLVYLILGTLPAAIVGVTLRDAVGRLFENATATSAMLIITGVFVLLTGRLSKEKTALRLPQALAIGVAQAVAIVPGLSRSGLTVGTGLALGVGKREAFEFSLLLSVPAVLAASVLEVLGGRVGGEPSVIIAAALTALLGGYVSISLLFRAIVRNKFHLFGYYLIPAGLVALVLTRVL